MLILYRTRPVSSDTSQARLIAYTHACEMAYFGILLHRLFLAASRLPSASKPTRLNGRLTLTAVSQAITLIECQRRLSAVSLHRGVTSGFGPTSRRLAGLPECSPTCNAARQNANQAHPTTTHPHVFTAYLYSVALSTRSRISLPAVK